MKALGMIRAALASIALAGAPIALAGCESFPAVSEAPQDARTSVAVAEQTFIGVLSSINALHSTGVVSNEQVAEWVPAFERINAALNTAQDALVLGDTVAALTNVNLANVDLATLAAILAALPKE